MKNATQSPPAGISSGAASTGSAWPVRSEAPASQQQHGREMPLLFQLADVNRLPAALIKPPPMPPAPVTAPAPVPAPLEMSGLAGTFPAAPSPLASTLLDSWPRTTAGLFETSTPLSTAALALGVAAVSKEEPPQALKAVIEPAIPAAVASALPAAIENAIKAATSLSDAPAAKVELKSEAKAEAKPELKTELKAETKTPVKTESTADRPKAPLSPAATSAPATKPVEVPASKAAYEKPSPGSLRRQRAEARQQKTDGKSGDWLQSHGKIIAIGFVFALLGTIYLARRNKGTESASPNTDPPVGLAIEVPGEHNHDHDGHDHKPAAAANTAPRLVEAPSHPLDATPSPAVTEPAGNPASTASADLHPPMVPGAGQPTSPTNSEPLFPWSNDPRMATRPGAPINAPAGTAPAAAPANGPTLNAPTYPETNLRDAPLLPPAPPDVQGQGQGQGRAPTRTSPASFTSAPGGNRYERTGSGLY